jgi:hypothetical protein
VLVLLSAALAASCGGDPEPNPVERQVADSDAGDFPLGFPLLATKNTTRVSGEDPVEDAAGVARAVYPGFDSKQRPAAIVFVDAEDWQGGIAAAALTARPLRAPILLTHGGDIPDVTARTAERLQPPGTALADRAQAFTIGDAGVPEGLRAVHTKAPDPYSLAAAIDALGLRLTGQRSSSVVIASGTDPRYAMPAAAWAAKSGDAVLFAKRDELPAPTRRAIARRDLASIYVLGPPSVIGEGVERRLRRLGRVRRIAGAGPVENAIAFARYLDGSFGWGLRDPGHGLAIANASRPLDAPAAAALAASGTYAPLLLTDSADHLPPPLRTFLLDIQPGYQTDPVRGVYNHAWLLGDEAAIAVAVQGQIDDLTEIVRVSVGETQ